MDLSRYDELGDDAPAELVAKYRWLREELKRLGAAPVSDAIAMHAVQLELDEVHAGIKHANKSASDPQRF